MREAGAPAPRSPATIGRTARETAIASATASAVAAETGTGKETATGAAVIAMLCCGVSSVMVLLPSQQIPSIKQFCCPMGASCAALLEQTELSKSELTQLSRTKGGRLWHSRRTYGSRDYGDGGHRSRDYNRQREDRGGRDRERGRSYDRR